jgi:cytidylate kinase
MKKGIIVAIDGPVAAGKGTIAPELAEKLHGFYLYTGATYRCLALYCLSHGVNFGDEKKIIAQLSHVSIDLYDNKVFLNDDEVTQEIKAADVARHSAIVAAIAQVRTAMVKRQQEIANKRRQEGKIILIEGRDTATVVFPDADLKVFLTAKQETRAQRRLNQYRAMGNTSVSFEDVLRDLQIRDEEDTQRVADPLVTDPEKHGYFVVDNSEEKEAETVDIIIDELRRRKLIQ